MRLTTIIVALSCLPWSFAAADQFQTAASQTERERVADYVAQAHQEEVHFDYDRAVIFYQKAADLGDASSMYELGWIYFGAHDVQGRHFQDYPKAAVWFQKAADLNYAPALTQLGVMYNSDGSFGLPKNPTLAFQLYSKAAQAGNAQAMNNLGVMYSQGQAVPRDIDEAVFWWKKAVEADKDGQSGRAAQSWLNLRAGKSLFSQ